MKIHTPLVGNVSLPVLATGARVERALAGKPKLGKGQRHGLLYRAIHAALVGATFAIWAGLARRAAAYDDRCCAG